jgi:hypothetical protein
MRTSSAIVGIASLLTLVGTASADLVTVALGGGWEVTYDNNGLTIQPISAANGQVQIRKIATFTEIDPFTNAPGARILSFRQVANDANTFSQIVITDEALTNNTGLTWIGFRQVIAQSPVVTFDNSSLALSIAPNFTSNQLVAGNRELVSSGGPGVNTGTTWNPGLASGAITINAAVGQQASPVVFTLKELAVVPTPGSAALIGLGILAAGRRRR